MTESGRMKIEEEAIDLEVSKTNRHKQHKPCSTDSKSATSLLQTLILFKLDGSCVPICGVRGSSRTSCLIHPVVVPWTSRTPPTNPPRGPIPKRPFWLIFGHA